MVSLVAGDGGQVRKAAVNGRRQVLGDLQPPRIEPFAAGFRLQSSLTHTSATLTVVVVIVFVAVLRHLKLLDHQVGLDLRFEVVQLVLKKVVVLRRR